MVVWGGGWGVNDGTMWATAAITPCPWPLQREAYQPTARDSRVKRLLHQILTTTIAAAALLAIVPLLHAKEAPPPPQRVMVFGDSLSAAYGMNANQGWVALMATSLKNDEVSVINASISGETTSGGLARIKTDLAKHRPTHVLIALGANDALRGLPIADMRKNLQAMIDAVRRANAKPILVGIQIPPNYGIDYARQFAALYPDLARRQKIPLVPFLLEGIADQLELFQPDRLHPTAAAQPRILKNVLPVIEPMFTPARITPPRR